MTRRFILLVFILCLIWFSGLLAYTSIVLGLRPYQGDAEGIVVLTGGDGRIEAGLQLLDDDRAPRLLISGVNQSVKLKQLLKLYQADPDLAPYVDLGFAAFDTLGNADETAEWVDKYHIQSLIIVTAHYHMPRALLHLGSQLPNVAIYPYPVVPKLFQQKYWYADPVALRQIIQAYNKFLATYPQIIFLKQVL